MTFSYILYIIGSKLIGLKFVGSSISPDLWIGIFIECFHGLGNTFVALDVLIITVMYGIVTIRLSLICWRLISSCPVDLVFLSFDIANITSAACTGWGLHNYEDFLVIRAWMCFIMYSLHFKFTGLDVCGIDLLFILLAFFILEGFQSILSIAKIYLHKFLNLDCDAVSDSWLSQWSQQRRHAHEPHQDRAHGGSVGANELGYLWSLPTVHWSRTTRHH